MEPDVINGIRAQWRFEIGLAVGAYASDPTGQGAVAVAVTLAVTVAVTVAVAVAVAVAVTVAVTVIDRSRAFGAPG